MHLMKSPQGETGQMAVILKWPQEKWECYLQGFPKECNFLVGKVDPAMHLNLISYSEVLHLGPPSHCPFV